VNEYGPVQSFPSGLLSMLGLKNTGLYPDKVGSTYQPTIEVLQWIMEGQAIEIGRSADFAGLPLGNQAWPAGNSINTGSEWWYVLDYSIYGNMVAAATSIVGFHPSWITNYPNGRSLLVGEPSGIVTSTAAGRRAVAKARGFWVPPTSELAVCLLANETATTQPLVGHVRYVPLRA
jgi:hypothetical protein